MYKLTPAADRNILANQQGNSDLPVFATRGDTQIRLDKASQADLKRFYEAGDRLYVQFEKPKPKKKLDNANERGR